MRSLPAGSCARPDVQVWFASNRTRWEQEEFIELADVASLRQAVFQWVQRRPPDGPQVDEVVLSEAVASFLHALSAAEPGDYLRQVSGTRVLRDIHSLRDDRLVQGVYHLLTGQPIPPSMSAQRLFELFWGGHPEATGRPVAVARGAALLEVRNSIPLSAAAQLQAHQRRRPGDPLWFRTYPRFSFAERPDYLERWSAPVVTTCPQLTMPRTGYEALVERYESIPVCQLRCVARTADGPMGVLGAYFYFSPDGAVWYVLHVTAEFERRPIWPI